MTVTLLEGHVVDVLAGLEPGTFHCAVCSPPYWQLRAYGTAPQDWGDGWTGELGQEPDPQDFVAHLVEVFRSVRRVLRQDATLWVNLAGAYWSDPGGQNGTTGNVSAKAIEANGTLGRQKRGRHPSLKPLDWVDVPGLFARAMQQDGWTWRSDVVWVKPSALPESISGTRWERCRVNVQAGTASQEPSKQASGTHGASLDRLSHGSRAVPERVAAAEASGSQWADCPGCPKCAANEGLVLRRGSGRPTKTHEHVLLFTRGPGYFYDTEGVREGRAEGYTYTGRSGLSADGYAPKPKAETGGARESVFSQHREYHPAGRNLRDVWTISPEPISDAHYAAYPSELPSRCIRAGTSEWGCCPSCGAPWARVVETRQEDTGRDVNRQKYAGGRDERGGTWTATHSEVTHRVDVTLGWRPTCACVCQACDGDGLVVTGWDEAAYENREGQCPHCAKGIPTPVPCRVLDPFGGSGTTARAANRLGRDCTLVELKPQYAELARKRVAREPLSLFAWQGQEALAAAGVAPKGEDAAPRDGTKQEAHPNRTVAGFNARWKAGAPVRKQTTLEEVDA